MPFNGSSYREVARKLRKAKFIEVSQKGSQVKFAIKPIQRERENNIHW